MNRFIFVLLLCLASSNGFSADAYEATLAKARQAAAAGNNEEAIKSYKALIKSLPKKDPRAEMLSAELLVLTQVSQASSDMMQVDKATLECILQMTELF